MNHDLRSLEARIRRAERNQRLLAAPLLAFVAVSLYVAAAPAQDTGSSELRVNRLVILDEHGVERLVLGELPEPGDKRLTRKGVDAVGIAVMDASGTERFAMGELPAVKNGRRRVGGYSLLIFDKNGVERGGYGTSDDGGAVLTLDYPDNDAVALFVTPDGASGLNVIDETPMGRANLAVLPNGDVRLSLTGAKGQPSGDLRVTAAGEASITLRKPDGSDVLVAASGSVVGKQD